MERYDWIIVGGSFAGLVTARKLPGKGLIIDRKPIGENETSACGTLIDVPLGFNIEESILQEHKDVLLHIGDKEIDFKTPYSFCVIDYRIFCTKLASYSDFDFIQARVTGRKNKTIFTTKGDFEADILIDASGWKSVLTDEQFPKNSYNTGLEVILSGKEEGLHFFYEGRKTKRVYWIFPAREKLRIGSGSYFGKEEIKEPLFTFVKNYNFLNPPQNFHSNIFPFFLRKPVVNGIFRVGDSAGQCLALTGEGIRPALYFGTFLNYLLKKVLSKEISIKSAQRIYTNFVNKKRKYYRMFTFFQKYLTSLPNQVIALSGKLASAKSFLFFEKYRKILDIKTLIKVIG